MSDREEFEKWYDEATDYNYGVAYYVDITGRYCHHDIDIAWQAWQAARAQSGQGAEPCGWLNKRGEILSADEKARLIESGGIVAASIRTNFTIPLYTHPQPAVPDKKPLPDLFMASYHEAIGWNACVDAMLARSPQPPKEGA